MKNIFLIIFLLFIIYSPNIAMAQVQLETGLPNIPASGLTPGQELPSYINYLFIFGLGAITILALAQMMSGGIQYILAAGNVSQTAEAKNTIQQALIGLGLLLASYLLLNTINPDLVNLRNPNLTPTQFREQTKQEISGRMGSYTGSSLGGNVQAGDPCSSSGDINFNNLVCMNGKWAIMSEQPY